VGAYETGYADAVAVSGDYAYVCGYSTVLRIIDVSTPDNPTQVGFYNGYGDGLDVALEGTLAYVADYNVGFRVIDVSTVSSPSQVGYYDTPGNDSGVAIAGGYAYVAARGQGVRVMDISTPTAPAEIGFYITSDAAEDVVVDGSYAYVAMRFDGLCVIDVSSPAAPAEITTMDTDSYAGNVYKSGHFLFIADGDSGVRVVNVSDPGSPFETGFYDTAGQAYGVFAAGDYLYAASGQGGLYVLDYDEFAPVTVAGFTATAVETGVRLEWSIEADEPIEGFRFARAEENGRTVTVPPGRLIPPEARSFVDATAGAGTVYHYTLFVVKPDGSEVASRTVSARRVAGAVQLRQNCPNPFNPATRISFVLPEPGRVSLSIHDVRGALVKVLVDGAMTGGLKEMAWDGTDNNGHPVGSGVYFYRLKAGKTTLTKKMLLVK
jgi:hypothetical protein